MINEELQKYVEECIFPIYNNNDKGHDIEHIKFVLNRTFEIINEKELNLNNDIAYVVACYHDIGHYLDKDNHEKVSADIMINDENLKQWFNLEELIIIKEAIEDHRASSDIKPRTIYGDVMKLADKNVKVENFFERAWSYSLKHYPDYNIEDHVERIYNHGIEKFGKEGYALLEFTDYKYEEYLTELQELLSDKELFEKTLKRIIC